MDKLILCLLNLKKQILENNRIRLMLKMDKKKLKKIKSNKFLATLHIMLK